MQKISKIVIVMLMALALSGAADVQCPESEQPGAATMATNQRKNQTISDMDGGLEAVNLPRQPAIVAQQDPVQIAILDRLTRQNQLLEVEVAKFGNVPFVSGVQLGVAALAAPVLLYRNNGTTAKLFKLFYQVIPAVPISFYATAFFSQNTVVAQPMNAIEANTNKYILVKPNEELWLDGGLVIGIVVIDNLLWTAYEIPGNWR